MANYSKSSAYYATQQFGPFLDVLAYRTIPKSTFDVEYIIDQIYQYKPQLLAYDLYKDTALWWVFAGRNPNVLIDPIFDFRTGRRIFIPTKQTLVQTLGL